jgi:hypothetical protein
MRNATMVRPGITVLVLVLLSLPAYAAGRIYMKQGYAIEAEDWWEDPAKNLLWYERNGLRAAVTLTDVAKIEGKSKAGTLWTPPAAPIGSRPNTAQPASNPTGPGAKTIKGKYTLIAADLLGERLSSFCAGAGGFSDIQKGKQVTVSDATGRVIGVGAFGDGWRRGPVTCEFEFTVEGVPQSDFYQIEVQRRGVLRYSLAEMQRLDWTVEMRLSSR